MKCEVPLITRRRFLGSSLPFLGLGLTAGFSTSSSVESVQLSGGDIEMFRARLLQLVNKERSLSGVAPLEIDDLANRVADEHAIDMVTGEFLSHWGRDGRKPYHRYSFAGGIHAIGENVAAANNNPSLSAAAIADTLEYMHMRMHGETPPNDGHRQTILAPQYTHVGFGIAMAGQNLRLVEEYVAKYAEIDPLERRAKRKTVVRLSGRLLNAKHSLQGIDVFYEPLPARPDIDWLRMPRMCGLPDEFSPLRLKLRDGMYYADGVEGVVEIKRGGRFSAPVRLFKDAPGIYTIALWVNAGKSKKPFQATAICIESD